MSQITVSEDLELGDLIFQEEEEATSVPSPTSPPVVQPKLDVTVVNEQRIPKKFRITTYSPDIELSVLNPKPMSPAAAQPVAKKVSLELDVTTENDKETAKELKGVEEASLPVTAVQQPETADHADVTDVETTRFLPEDEITVLETAVERPPLNYWRTLCGDRVLMTEMVCASIALPSLLYALYRTFI